MICSILGLFAFAAGMLLGGWAALRFRAWVTIWGAHRMDS